MRTPVATLATALLLASASAFAQPAQPAPVRTEGPFSPLVYERLGATPSIQLRKAPAAPAEAKAPAEARTQEATRAPGRTGAAAAKADPVPAQAAAPVAATKH
jgi:hypothetical protein